MQTQDSNIHPLTWAGCVAALLPSSIGFWMALARGDGYATGFFLGWTLSTGLAMAALVGIVWWLGGFRETLGNVAVGALGVVAALISALTLMQQPSSTTESRITATDVPAAVAAADSVVPANRAAGVESEPAARTARRSPEPRDENSVFGGLDDEIGINDDAVRSAVRQYTTEADAIWKRIADASNRFREPGFLDPNYLSSREIVTKRRSVISDYRQALARMRGHLTRRKAILNQLMATNGVSAGKQRNVADELRRMDPIFQSLIDYLDAEVDIGQTVESMFTTLEQNWTSWQTHPRTGDIYFSNPAVMQKYNDLVLLLRSQVSRADSLRARAIAALP